MSGAIDFYVVEPEVAGGLGEGTQLDRSVHPPLVSRLHYVFDGWLGDDLIESFPCFIVTERLAVHLSESGLSGFQFRPTEVKPSEMFGELYPGRLLPTFRWLHVTGRAGLDDFGTTANARLVISSLARQCLAQFCVEQATFQLYTDGS